MEEPPAPTHQGAEPAEYVAFFARFNERRFFEAHEVLESLWLKDRSGPDGAFYKGLIQLAGAFVHVQKGRPDPAVALLKLCERNLATYPPMHHGLALPKVQLLLAQWQDLLQHSYPQLTALAEVPYPELTPAIPRLDETQRAVDQANTQSV